MKHFVLGLIFLHTACTHSVEKFEAPLAKKDCSLALKNIPELQPLQKTADSAAWATKNLAAYSYVGLNYTAELAWDVSAGTLMFVGLCLPELALMTVATKNGAGYGRFSGVEAGTGFRTALCFPVTETSKKVLAPPLGRRAYESTHSLRCPDVKGLVQSYVKVIACYEETPSKENLSEALLTIDELQSNRGFNSCVEPGQQQGLIERRAQIINKLQAL